MTRWNVATAMSLIRWTLPCSHRAPAPCTPLYLPAERRPVSTVTKALPTSCPICRAYLWGSMKKKVSSLGTCMWPIWSQQKDRKPTIKSWRQTRQAFEQNGLVDGTVQPLEGHQSCDIAEFHQCRKGN